MQAKTRLTTVVPISHMAPQNKFCFPPPNSVLPHFFFRSVCKLFSSVYGVPYACVSSGSCLRNGAVVSHLSGKAEFEKLHRLHLCDLKTSMKFTARTWDILSRNWRPACSRKCELAVYLVISMQMDTFFSGTFLSLLLVFCPLA